MIIHTVVAYPVPFDTTPVHLLSLYLADVQMESRVLNVKNLGKVQILATSAYLPCNLTYRNLTVDYNRLTDYEIYAFAFHYFEQL
jgi:hypothetical protein